MLTLALFKPEVVAFPPVCWVCLQRILCNKLFRLIHAKRIILTQDQVEKFYGAHSDKFFYPRLKSHILSGPVMALILAGDNVISDWRNFIGKTRVYESIYTEKGTLRADFGLSDSRNLAHGSDSPVTAQAEIDILFPGKFEEFRRKSEDTNLKIAFEELASMIFKPNIESWAVDCVKRIDN